MSADNTHEEAVELLQQLGLKEYEAKCFVGLSRLPTGTAKQLSEIADVPRTRVYDAVRMLEAQGLVEVHHSSPQRFRAVSVDEAVATLRDQYDDRVDRLKSALERTEPVESSEEPVQKVWTLSGADGIANRTNRLIEDADDEIVLILGDESLMTDDLIDALTGRAGDVDIVVGTSTQSLSETVRARVPDATVFVSGLDWLREEDEDGEKLAIGRLLLVDRSALLVSTITADGRTEHAVFGTGFRNGIIVIARRLLSQGLLAESDPTTD